MSEVFLVTSDPAIENGLKLIPAGRFGLARWIGEQVSNRRGDETEKKLYAAAVADLHLLDLIDPRDHAKVSRVTRAIAVSSQIVTIYCAIRDGETA